MDWYTDADLAEPALLSSGTRMKISYYLFYSEFMLITNKISNGRSIVEAESMLHMHKIYWVHFKIYMFTMFDLLGKSYPLMILKL